MFQSSPLGKVLISKQLIDLIISINLVFNYDSMILIINYQQIDSTSFCVIFKDFTNWVFNSDFARCCIYLKIWIYLFYNDVNKGFKEFTAQTMIAIRIQQFTQKRRMQPDLTSGESKQTEDIEVLASFAFFFLLYLFFYNNL